MSTWEGLQACHELKKLGIKTLATTLFTLEQAILAAEAGCTYIAPFVHELKAFFDETLVITQSLGLFQQLTKSRYKDDGPIIPLCLQIQRYYEKHSHKTRVKAAGLLSVHEAMQLAGIDSMTVAPDLLRTLSKTEEPEDGLIKLSVFTNTYKLPQNHLEPTSFIDDEPEFRKAFAESERLRGPVKTAQVRR